MKSMIPATNSKSHLKAIQNLCAAFGIMTIACNAWAGPFVLAYTDGQLHQASVNLELFHGKLSAVGLGSAYGMTDQGIIDESGANSITDDIIKISKSNSLPIYPTISDYNQKTERFDEAISNSILTDPVKFTSSIQNLVSFANSKVFAGIDLDFEAVEPKNKDAFSRYVRDLGKALHASGKKLIISIPAKISDLEPEYLGGYDYAAIGRSVDYFQVMTYDQVGPGWSSGGFNGETWPGPESGADWQKAMLEYAVSRVPAKKVLSGLPTYGYDYSTKDQVHWANYTKVISAHKATVSRDSASQTPFATWGPVTQFTEEVKWSKETAQPVLWFDDTASIVAKTRLVGALNLAGTSVWAMGYENAEFWSAVEKGLKATK